MERSAVTSLIHATDISVPTTSVRHPPAFAEDSLGSPTRSGRGAQAGFPSAPNPIAPTEFSCTATGCHRQGSWCVRTKSPHRRTLSQIDSFEVFVISFRRSPDRGTHLGYVTTNT